MEFDDLCKQAVDRRSFLRVAQTALAAVLPIGSAESAEQAGQVENVKGAAFAEAADMRRELDREAPLFIADKVITGAGARLAMRLGRDTLLKLGERARLTIDRFLVNAGGEIVLESGPLLFERPPGSAPAPMQIRSTFGLIAVRGTRFFAGPSQDVFGVFVERGSVAVSAGGRRVLVQAGQGTNIRKPGAKPTKPAQWGPQRIRAALESVS